MSKSINPVRDKISNGVKKKNRKIKGMKEGEIIDSCIYFVYNCI